MARHRTPSDDVATAILGAAEALLEAEGPRALSVRRIAERARVAPMGIYSRFESKDGVIDALFAEGFAALGATIRATATIPDPLEAFEATGRAYRALALAHPARYEVMFLHAIAGFVPSDASIEVAADSFAALVEAVGRCIDAGRFGTADPVEVAQQVWAACHGWVALELRGVCFAEDRDGGYERLLDLLAAGLSATSP